MIQDKKASNEDEDETTASSAKDSDDGNGEKEEEEPKLAEEEIKASKGTGDRKIKFKIESANHCSEVNVEDDTYQEIANAMKATKKTATEEKGYTTAAKKSIEEPTAVEPVYVTQELDIYTLDEKAVTWADFNKYPEKYYYIENEAELERLRAERKAGVSFKGDSAEKIKGGTFKDNPDKEVKLLKEGNGKKKKGGKK